MNQNLCNNCGGEYEYRGGRFICRSCGAYKPEEISNEEVTLLYTAYQNLRLAEFDAAEKEFDDIIEKYPQNPNGYWGRLMARYGIKYERDFDGRMIPTCYATSIESVIASSDYKRAMEYADKDTREYYRRQAEYIERVRKEWVEKASREKPYDIFISYKDSDLANGIDRTEDSIEMQELYIHLTNKGYRVFFSRESLRDKVGEKYEPYIFSALSTAKVMLVYGSKPEYITSTWLKNEWTRYEKRIAAGEKKPESLLVACDGFSPAELPRELSSRQCFNANTKSFYSELDATLERLLREPKKKAATVAEPIFRDVEPEAVKPEEKKKKSFVPFIFIGLFVLICGFAVYTMMGGSLGSSDPTYEASTTDDVHIWIPGVNDGNDDNKEDDNKDPWYSESTSGKEPWGGDPDCVHEIVTEGGEAPTCDKEGWTAKEYCLRCNMSFKDQERIPALGHTPGPEADASHSQVCTVCGEELERWKGTAGLAYKDSGDGSWIVEGIGTATDTEIYIPDYYEGKPVKMIAANAFKDQTQLTAIHLPETMSEIGARAFYGCTGLTELTITEQVFKIGAQAIYRCDNLKTLYFRSIYYFGEDENSFLKQSSVEKVIFDGEGVSSILHGVTTVTEVVFTDNVLHMGRVGACPSLKKVTIGSNVTELYGFRDCTGLEEIVIPAHISMICSEAFYGCTSLSKVTFEGDVEIIDNYAFADCPALTEIILPESVTEIRDHAFWNSGIVSITIPENVAELGIEVFARCESLREVILPDGLMDIPYQAFLGCTSLTSVNIPESVYSIGESAFKECTALRTITLPFDLVEIKTSAFEGCMGLVEVINHSALELRAGDTEHGYVAYYALIVHDGEESQLKAFGDFTVYDQGEKYLLLSYNGTDTELVLPDMIGGKCYTIAQGAFAGRSDITSITVHDAVQEIGMGAFAGCTGLVSIDLPFVGGSAESTEKFSYFFELNGYTVPTSLTSVTIRGGVIGERAFESCSNLKEIILGEGVTSIGEYAFNGCTSLNEIVIPNSVTEIEVYAFSGCHGLVSMTTPLAHPTGQNFFYYFFGDDGAALHSDLKTGLKTVIFTGDTLLNQAFENCWTIEEIILTGNVTEIADGAFRSCEALKTIVLPDGVTTIGKYAFYDCKQLETIVIPEGVTTIGERAFSGCNKLSEITLPSTLTSIGMYAFESCELLTEIVIPEGVTTIGAYAFYSCTSLTEIVIPEGVTAVGEYAFHGCTALVSMTTPFACPSDKYERFYYFFGDGPAGLKTVTITGNALPARAFENCQTIEEIILTGNVTEIGENAFYGCSALKKIELPETLTKIGQSAFFGCSALSEITIPSGVTKIERGTFESCGSLKKIVLSEGVTTIGECVFLNCRDLVEISIPSTLNQIGASAFAHCESLTTINFAGTQAQWNAISFDANWNSEMSNYTIVFNADGVITEPTEPEAPTYSEGLDFYPNGDGTYTVTGIGTCTDKDIIIPSTYNGGTVTMIGQSAFAHLSEITSVTIPECVTKIGPWAFWNSPALASVEIPDSVTEICEHAFRDCVGLTFVTIPEGVTEIGMNVFDGCTALKEVVLPASLETIGEKAFYNCMALDTITYGGTEEQWSKIQFESEWDYNIGAYTLVCAGGAGEPEAPGIPSDVRVDQTVTFGSYEQDNDTSNGAEAIEWIVLDVQDGKALVISKYALESRAYSSYVQGLNFASSDIYKWLNSDFIYNAFSDEERAKIVTTTITADPNPYYETNQGGDYDDKLFLLSIEEVEQYFDSDESRVCESTESMNIPGGICSWWLRTMGENERYAAYVVAAGNVDYKGDSVGTRFGIRPAMWVELNP